MSGSASIPLALTSAGPTPTPPATLNAALISEATAIDPTLTTDLPGSLIEDLSSTGTGGLIVVDQARVDAVNSVTPLGANPFILAALGQQFGIPQGIGSNASVDVQFSGSAGYVIQAGFTVSDGTNQYTVQNGTVIPESGPSPQITAICTNSNQFAIPAGSVTRVITSVPTGYTVAVTNPEAGTPLSVAQTVPQYRSQVMQAGIVTSTGTPNYLRTLLQQITGVQANLISMPSISGGGWQVICGGGNAYQIAGAILQGVPDIATLQGSQLAITGVTAAAEAVFTTNLTNNFTTGQTFIVAGATPSAFNGTYTVVSATATTITTSTNSAAFGAYTGGAYFSPNPRNVTVSLFQNPNTYNVTFVNPPLQTVTVAVVWNTNLPNFTAGTSVNQLGVPAIQNYINSIYVGQPINLLEAQAAFQAAVASVLPTVSLTTLQFTVGINGATVSPAAGTSIIEGDPESYFNCSATGVVVNQG